MQKEPTQRTGQRDPIRQLTQCHEKIAAHLAQLEAFAEADDGAVGERRAAVESIVRWFETNGARHRVDEEESVFPRLAVAATGDPALNEALQALVAEHGEEDALVGELAGTVRALTDDPPGGAASAARDAALRVVTHFRRHLDVEDRVVLPAAGRALDADLAATVAAEMERRRTEGSSA